MEKWNGFTIDKFVFNDRNKEVYNQEFLQALKMELAKLCGIRLTKEEFQWLENGAIRYIPLNYWEWLRQFTFDTNKINVFLDEEQHLQIEVVDKMYKASLTENERDGIDAFKKVDMSAYTKSVSGMFGGNEQKVKLRFANHLVGAVLDRFGRDSMIIKDGNEHFTVSVNVVVSQQFLAWVFGFGADAEILSPESAREEMKKYIMKMGKEFNYRKDLIVISNILCETRNVL